MQQLPRLSADRGGGGDTRQQLGVTERLKQTKKKQKKQANQEVKPASSDARQHAA